MRTIKTIGVLVLGCFLLFGATRWPVFEFRDYGFKVALPLSPEKKVLSEEADSFVVSFVARTEKYGCVVTIVQVRDDEEARKNLPKTPAETANYLDRIRDGYLKSLGPDTKVSEEKSLVLQGFPARWIRVGTTLNGQEYVSEAEFILAGRRIYSANVLALKGTDPVEFREFLPSFQIVDHDGKKLAPPK